MTWNAPITWSLNQTVTSAQLNAYVSQNMLETAPAKAVGGVWPQHFTVANTNSIAPREIRTATVGGSEATTSTSFTNLTTVGPAITLTTGSFAMIFPASRMVNTAGGFSYASFDVTGASTLAADLGDGVINQGTNDVRAAGAALVAVTPGVNVFTMKYRVSSGTGTFEVRRIVGWGL